MPHQRGDVYCNEATPAERRSLLSVRLQCLDEATTVANSGSPLPARDRWGWRAIIKTLGRDRDGSLLASVTVYDPSENVVMLRNVRLVPERRLNYS